MSFSGVIEVGKTYVRRNGFRSTCILIRGSFTQQENVAIFDCGPELWTTGYRTLTKTPRDSDIVEELPTEINLSELL